MDDDWLPRRVAALLRAEWTCLPPGEEAIIDAVNAGDFWPIVRAVEARINAIRPDLDPDTCAGLKDRAWRMICHALKAKYSPIAIVHGVRGLIAAVPIQRRCCGGPP